MRSLSALVVAGILLAGVTTVEGQSRPAGTASAAAPAASGAAKAATPGPINLNTATVSDLQGLPGVGQKTAERIVEYRQKNGNFKKIEELMNIRGIGEKNFLKLKALITVTPPRSDT